jgi:hypothetical protein
MIAAIYARKSTEQTGVADDQKSITRQIDQASDDRNGPSDLDLENSAIMKEVLRVSLATLANRPISEHVPMGHRDYPP